VPSYLLLDVYCDTCHRDAGGDPGQLRSAPRLARFERDMAGGPIAVRPFAGKGPWREPFPPRIGPQGRRAFPPVHRRPDGGWTWQLRCPHGHYRPVQHERIRAAFEAFPPGRDTWRVPL
jgi:hypothetical protein